MSHTQTGRHQTCQLGFGFSKSHSEGMRFLKIQIHYPILITTVDPSCVEKFHGGSLVPRKYCLGMRLHPQNFSTQLIKIHCKFHCAYNLIPRLTFSSTMLSVQVSSEFRLYPLQAYVQSKSINSKPKRVTISSI